MMSWRQYCAPIIKRVIDQCGTEDMKLLRKKLHAAYPFGERKYHPYKIWCDEIRSQLGLKRATSKKLKAPAFNAGEHTEQISLFHHPQEGTISPCQKIS
jgi:hypothetical protein